MSISIAIVSGKNSILPPGHTDASYAKIEQEMTKSSSLTTTNNAFGLIYWKTKRKGSHIVGDHGYGILNGKENILTTTRIPHLGKINQELIKLTPLTFVNNGNWPKCLEKQPNCEPFCLCQW